VNSGTHLQRWVFGLLVAAFALYCDKASLGTSRSLCQQILWNLVVVGEFLIELRPTLRRTRAACIALAMFCLHCLAMYRYRAAFPFDSSLILMLCAIVECVMFMIVYLRLCQCVDPQGPFGLSAAEEEARSKRRVRLF
jgi:hypothetical protein